MLVRAESCTTTRLREVSGSTLPLGVALQDHIDRVYTWRERALIRRHFKVITPEAAMKWPNCEPEPGKHNFANADDLVAYAEHHDQKILGHTLLFNRDNEYPPWVFAHGSKKASAKLVEERLRDHIRTMMGRYSGRVYAWDVVNEAVEETAPYYRQTDWYHTFGKAFVPMAFLMAREADPNAQLVYNDFSIENPPKRERVLILLDELRREGVLPDVVGIQGHFELDRLPYDDIEKTIVALHDAGVRVAVTELDIDVVSRAKYWDLATREEAIKQNPYPDGCPADVLARQAEQYGTLFRLFVKHVDKMERVTFWGLTDRHSWLNDWPWKRSNHGLIFDREARPKPAFYAVMDALRPLTEMERHGGSV